MSVPATLPVPSDCSVTFDLITEVPRVAAEAALDASNQLAESLFISMTVLGNSCGLLTVRFATGFGIETRPVELFSLTRGRVTLPKGDGDPTEPFWTSPPEGHLIEVFNNCPDVTCTDTPLDTANLVVS